MQSRGSPLFFVEAPRRRAGRRIDKEAYQIFCVKEQTTLRAEFAPQKDKEDKVKINEEKCLQKYFEAQVALTNHLDNAQFKRLFDALADAYGVGAERRDRLFALVENDELKQIDSDDLYKRQKRIRQYSEDYGLDEEGAIYPPELLDIKGNAINADAAAKIAPGDQQTSSDIASRVAKAARTGNTTAMFLSALMYFEGLIVKKDVELATRTLRKLALWTSTDAQLLGIAYDPENATQYAARLAALTVGLPEAELMDICKAKLAVLPREDAGMRLLRKATEKGYAQADCYNSNFARVAHSEILSVGDKQRVLLSGDANFVSAVSSLPLKLPKKPVKLTISEVKTRFARIEEQKKIARVLSSAKMRESVCFESEDTQLLKEYAEAIKLCIGCGNVQCIDFEKLDASELESETGNIFLRSINEDETNVFLISVGEGSDPINLELALNFLDSFKRAHFKVRRLGVELNLSSVCVVPFVDSALRNSFQGRVTFVPLAKVSDKEKETVIDVEVAKFAQSGEFGDELTLADDARQKLVAMDLEDSAVVLEQAARHAFIDGSSVITAEHVSQSLDEVAPNQTSFGFVNRE